MALLRNGTQEPLSLVRPVTASLRELLSTDPTALIELAAHCRDPRHAPACGLEPYRPHGFLTPEGRIHPPIRNVILSAVPIGGPRPVVVDPVQRVGR